MITTLAVQVTQDDIDSGCPGPHGCAITKAAIRALKNRGLSAEAVTSSCGSINTWNGLWDNVISSHPNKAADEFMCKFDKGLTVSPTEFLFFFV